MTPAVNSSCFFGPGISRPCSSESLAKSAVAAYVRVGGLNGTFVEVGEGEATGCTPPSGGTKGTFAARDRHFGNGLSICYSDALICIT